MCLLSSHWLLQSEARGQESSDGVVPRNQAPGTQSRARKRAENGSGRPKKSTPHGSCEVRARPGPPDRTQVAERIGEGTPSQC